MGRPTNCNCRCVPCNPVPVTLKGYDKASGTLLWETWLEAPVVSSDGYIYGYAYEESSSAAALACRILPLSGAGAGGPVNVAANSVKRYKKWIRKIDPADGSTVADSTLFWYTDNDGYVVSVCELPDWYYSPESGFRQDLFGANADGELVAQFSANSAGTALNEKCIVWDSNNTTTTRRYTFVGAAVRNLATVPTGGCKLRFVAENDGTNAEQTLDVANMIGLSAADLATAVETLPHVSSASATGGPYPFVAIELTVVWGQNTTHFKSITRLTSTSRGYRTWLRDWDTGDITATVADPTTVNSTADRWQFDDSDELIGISTNPASGLGIPIAAGIAVERFTRSGASFTQSWRRRPTLDRGPVWGGTSTGYTRPAIRAGTLIVGHDNARGDGQGVGDHSEWHQLDLAAGTITAIGGTNDRRHMRQTFAADGQLISVGWDSFVDNIYSGSTYQCENGAQGPNFVSLMDGITGYTKDYSGPYGQWYSKKADQIVGDTTAMYSCAGFGTYHQAPGAENFNADRQIVINASNQAICTVLTRYGTGGNARVAPDAYFGLQNYYRVQHTFRSPINYRWITTNMQWRVAFFSNANVTTSSTPTLATAWLNFTDDETDLLTALAAIFPDNDAGPNAFVDGPAYPQGADEPMPQMIWQRGITCTFPAESGTPPWNLNSLSAVLHCFIQVKADTAGEFFLQNNEVARVDWDSGDVIWSTPFGESYTAGGVLISGVAGVLFPDVYVVYGARVRSTCYCVFQWQDVEGVPQWVLVVDACPAGRIATEPASAGTTLGEYQEGTCELA